MNHLKSAFLFLLLFTPFAFAIETIFDCVVYLEKDLILEIPKVPALCAQLALDKKKVNIGDCNLYCEIEGKGVPIVLVSGGPGTSHHIFHPYFSKAKDFAQIIYYDQRGVGQSDYVKGMGYIIDQAVEDLEALRKQLKVDKWIVLGHSYGGIIAQSYALKYLDNLKGLVLVASMTGLPNVDFESGRQGDYLSKEEAEKNRDIIRKYFSTKELSLEQAIYNMLLNGSWKRQNYYKPTKERMAQIALYEWKPSSYDEFFDPLDEEANKKDLEGKFKDFKIPTMIIEGKWDLTWNTDKAEKFHKNHPSSTLVMFEKSGHSPFVDEENKFFDELKKFMEKVEGKKDK